MNGNLNVSSAHGKLQFLSCSRRSSAQVHSRLLTRLDEKYTCAMVRTETGVTTLLTRSRSPISRTTQLLAKLFANMSYLCRDTLETCVATQDKSTWNIKKEKKKRIDSNSSTMEGKQSVRLTGRIRTIRQPILEGGWKIVRGLLSLLSPRLESRCATSRGIHYRRCNLPVVKKDMYGDVEGWRLSIRRLKSSLTKIATRKQATISFIETVRVFGDPTPLQGPRLPSIKLLQDGGAYSQGERVSNSFEPSSRNG